MAHGDSSMTISELSTSQCTGSAHEVRCALTQDKLQKEIAVLQAEVTV